MAVVLHFELNTYFPSVSRLMNPPHNRGPAIPITEVHTGLFSILKLYRQLSNRATTQLSSDCLYTEVKWPPNLSPIVRVMMPLRQLHFNNYAFYFEDTFW